MEVGDREREAARVAADLVEQRAKRFSGRRPCPRRPSPYRRRRLLEANDERVVAPLLEQENPRQPSRQIRLARSPRGRPVRPGRLRLDVGAVDGERGERLLPVPSKGSFAARAARPRPRTSSRACSSFASAATRREGRALAGQLLVEPRQRLLGGRVDEDRRHVVQRTRSPSCPRPASRAATRRARGSSRPRRARRPASAAARSSGAGSARPSGWSIRGPSSDARRATSSTTFACVISNTSSSSFRTPASSPTSKKRRGDPVRQSRSKNFARQSGSRQNGFSSLAAMWFGTTSSTAPSPAAAERAELLLAAELVRDPGRVDDVVAVCRATPRLERRREVEVRDPELPQVGHERARPGEVEVRPELQPIRWRASAGRSRSGSVPAPRRKSSTARPDFWRSPTGPGGDPSRGRSRPRAPARLRFGEAAG